MRSFLNASFYISYIYFSARVSRTINSNNSVLAASAAALKVSLASVLRESSRIVNETR